MRLDARILIAVILLISTSAGQTLAHAPTIINISPNASAVGASVAITGTNFGSTQGSSTISLNGTNAVASWSNTNIVAVVPTGATSGTFSVTVNGQTAYSSSFTVTALPSGWSDGDVGSVGHAGSATWTNGTFTVHGGGGGFTGTADAFNFAYQPLSGDGTIVARVVSSSSTSWAGVTIRETLSTGSTDICSLIEDTGYPFIKYRSTTGGNTSQLEVANATLPYWLKAVRSGTTFSSYVSSDGVNWVQSGTSQTISMAQNVYIGLGVASGNTSNLATATFDRVTISSSAMAVPSISNISATTGPVGTQIGISCSGFGASEGSSVVMLSGIPVPINSWSDSAIIFTIPTGATSG